MNISYQSKRLHSCTSTSQSSGLKVICRLHSSKQTHVETGDVKLSCRVGKSDWPLEGQMETSEQDKQKCTHSNRHSVLLLLLNEPSPLWVLSTHARAQGLSVWVLLSALCVLVCTCVSVSVYLFIYTGLKNTAGSCSLSVQIGAITGSVSFIIRKELAWVPKVLQVVRVSP